MLGGLLGLVDVVDLAASVIIEKYIIGTVVEGGASSASQAHALAIQLGVLGQTGVVTAKVQESVEKGDSTGVTIVKAAAVTIGIGAATAIVIFAAPEILIGSAALAETGIMIGISEATGLAASGTSAALINLGLNVGTYFEVKLAIQGLGTLPLQDVQLRPVLVPLVNAAATALGFLDKTAQEISDALGGLLRHLTPSPKELRKAFWETRMELRA